MILRHLGYQLGTVSITFVLPGTIWAEGVHLVGDFNDWNRNSHPLIFGEDGWRITLDLARGNRFRFRYLLDNAQWCNDWNADSYVSNPLGGYDSVLAI